MTTAEDNVPMNVDPAIDLGSRVPVRFEDGVITRVLRQADSGELYVVAGGGDLAVVPEGVEYAAVGWLQDGSGQPSEPSEHPSLPSEPVSTEDIVAQSAPQPGVKVVTSRSPHEGPAFSNPLKRGKAHKIR